MFGWFKKVEVKKPKFVPRTWGWPRDKVARLLEIRNTFHLNRGSDFHRFEYYTALADAGFDGFDHGLWSFRFTDQHNKHFPCPYLEEIDPALYDESE